MRLWTKLRPNVKELLEGMYIINKSTSNSGSKSNKHR